jgi:ABC-type branched-subunit amino acid transport system ATPase component
MSGEIRATVLVTDRLTHRYGDRLALDSVPLEVQAREIFGLLRPNCGGKTTLFRFFPHSLGRAAVRHDLGLDVVENERVTPPARRAFRPV